jgi:hypothetical protein
MQPLNNFHLSTFTNDYKTTFFNEKNQNLHNFQFHERKIVNIFIKQYEEKEISMKNVAISQEQTHKKNNDYKSFEMFLVKKRSAKPFKSPS